MYLRLYVYMCILNEADMNTSCLDVHTLMDQKFSIFLTLHRLY